MDSDLNRLNTPESAKRKEMRFPTEVVNKLTRDGRDTSGFDLSQPIAVEDLKKEGIAMINYIGDGSNPVIGRLVSGKDLSNKVFLTDEDLVQVKAESTPEGVSEEKLNQIADDMNKFVSECLDLRTIHAFFSPEINIAEKSEMRALIRTAGNRITTARKNRLNPFRKAPQWVDIDMEVEESIIRDALEVFKNKYSGQKGLDSVRGIPLENISGRVEGKHLSSQCPLLGCNHTFDARGVKINDEDGKLSGMPGTTLRINDVVTHLASHGISNTDKPNDPSQRYLTIKEFMTIYEQRGKGQKIALVPAQLQLERGIMVVREAFRRQGLTVSEDELARAVHDFYQGVI